MAEQMDSLNRTRRFVALGLLGLPLVLAACGKKNNPRPPSGDDAPFPRDYPNPNQQPASSG